MHKKYRVYLDERTGVVISDFRDLECLTQRIVDDAYQMRMALPPNDNKVLFLDGPNILKDYETFSDPQEDRMINTCTCIAIVSMTPLDQIKVREFISRKNADHKVKSFSDRETAMAWLLRF